MNVGCHRPFDGVLLRVSVLKLVGYLLSCFFFFRPASAPAQLSATWLDPADGNWNDAANWSTNPVFPNNGSPAPGTTYHAAINALGSPYTVSLDTDVSVDSLILGSANATLNQDNGSTLTISNVLAVGSGKYVLEHGKIQGGPINVAPSGLFRVRGGEFADLTLTGEVVVRDDASGNDGVLILRQGTVLANATLRLRGADRPAQLWINHFPEIPVLAGNGEIVFDGTPMNSFTFGLAQIRGFSIPPTATLDIGPGITIRTGTSGGSIRTDGHLVLQGLVSAQTPNATLEVLDNRSVTNQGTLEATNGGTLLVHDLTGPVGTLNLGEGSTLDLRGDFDFNQAMVLVDNSLVLRGDFNISQPIEAKSGSTLELVGGWTNTSTVSADRALLRLSGEQFDASLVHATDTIVELYGGATPTSALRQLNDGGNVLQFRSSGGINNENDALDTAEWNGDLTFLNGFIRGGSVVSSDSTGLRGTSGATIGLEDVVLEANLVVPFGGNVHLGGSPDNGLAINRATIQVQNSPIGLSLRYARNEGQIELINSTLTTRDDWSNIGTINLTAGRFNLGGTPTDIGTISVTSAQVNIDTRITTAQLESIDMNDVTLLLGETNNRTGIIDNTADVFELNASTGSLVVHDGFIIGGRVRLKDGQTIMIDRERLTLFGITLEGELGPANSFDFSILDGITLDNAKIPLVNEALRPHLRTGIRFGTTSSEQRSLVVAGDGEITFEGPGTQHQLRTEGRIVEFGSETTVRTVNGSGLLIGENVGSDANGFVIHGALIAEGIDRTLTVQDVGVFQTDGLLMARDGGQLIVNAPPGLDVGLGNWDNEGTIHLDHGMVTITGNTFANAADGIIEGVGDLDVRGTTFVNEGMVAPGLPTERGTLTVDGDLDLAAIGLLLIEVGASELDLLEVTGNLAPGGTLSVQLEVGFSPIAGDRFDILNFDSLTPNREFGQIQLPPLSANLAWDVNELLKTGEILVRQVVLEGDANNDGFISGADLIAVLQNFGSVGSSDGALLGDANDDGAVTGADLISVQQNFGKALAAPVPEPAVMVMLLAGCLLARRRS